MFSIFKLYTYQQYIPKVSCGLWYNFFPTNLSEFLVFMVLCRLCSTTISVLLRGYILLSEIVNKDGDSCKYTYLKFYIFENKCTRF